MTCDKCLTAMRLLYTYMTRRRKDRLSYKFAVYRCPRCGRRAGRKVEDSQLPSEEQARCVIEVLKESDDGKLSLVSFSEYETMLAIVQEEISFRLKYGAWK